MQPIFANSLVTDKWTRFHRGRKVSRNPMSIIAYFPSVENDKYLDPAPKEKKWSLRKIRESVQRLTSTINLQKAIENGKWPYPDMYSPSLRVEL